MVCRRCFLSVLVLTSLAISACGLQGAMLGAGIWSRMTVAGTGSIGHPLRGGCSATKCHECKAWWNGYRCCGTSHFLPYGPSTAEAVISDRGNHGVSPTHSTSDFGTAQSDRVQRKWARRLQGKTNTTRPINFNINDR